MRISASVMAHPEREPLVADLVAALGREVPVSWDREGPASGRGDRVWRNARAAWEMAEEGADFHLLLQDDAQPCADLLEGLEGALRYVPGDSLVSAYLGRGRNVPPRWERMTQQADRRGAAWIRSHVLMWGVAVVAPVALVPAMIEWCDRKAGMPDDMRVGRWFQRQKIDTRYTWPSLVDHLPVPSITKHRASDRVAARHHPGSALELDWSTGEVVDPMIVRSRGPRSGPSGAWRAAVP